MRTVGVAKWKFSLWLYTRESSKNVCLALKHKLNYIYTHLSQNPTYIMSAEGHLQRIFFVIFMCINKIQYKDEMRVHFSSYGIRKICYCDILLRKSNSSHYFRHFSSCFCCFKFCFQNVLFELIGVPSRHLVDTNSVREKPFHSKDHVTLHQ